MEWVKDKEVLIRARTSRFFEVDDDGRFTGRQKMVYEPTDKKFPVIEVIAVGVLPGQSEVIRRK